MGSIYKITDGEKNYYGSTIKTLKKRLSIHKSPSSTRCETKYMNKDNMTIELIEVVEDIEQLKWRERYYIENNECVNKNSPVITLEEHNERRRNRSKKHREENKDEYKQYYEENKERIKQYNRQPYTCECGSVFNMGDRARHFKSKKHILYCDTI